MKMTITLVCAAVFASSAARGAEPPESAPVDDLTAIGGEDWPRWRGPRGDGTWRGPQLPDAWPKEGLPVRWRQPIGPGYSGVTAANGRVYTMDRPSEERDGGPADEVPAAPPQAAENNAAEAERVLCFDASTGKLLWTHRYEAAYGDLDYGKGPRAAPTIAGNHVYTLGAVGHLHCLTAATGEVVWSRMVADAGEGKEAPDEPSSPLPMWGLSASPVVFENLLIVQADAKPDGCLIAFDRARGKELWRSLSDPAGYATPILIERDDRPELICWTSQAVRGLDPRTGKLRWSVPFEVTYATAIATPIYREGTVYVTSYWEGSKAIRLGDDLAEATLVWEDNRHLRGLMSQPLYRDGYAYQLDKQYGLTCFEYKTGRKLWDDKNRMTPRGRNPQATMVWTGDGDRVLALNSDGELIRAAFTPAGYRELSRTKIIGETWAHPAYAWGHVFARSDTELVAVRLIANDDGAP